MGVIDSVTILLDSVAVRLHIAAMRYRKIVAVINHVCNKTIDFSKRIKEHIYQ